MMADSGNAECAAKGTKYSKDAENTGMEKQTKKEKREEETRKVYACLTL